jgi:hypothetical protein
MTNDDENEYGRELTHDEDDEPRPIEIVLPRVRSIVWLGIKVYVIVVIGLSLLGVAVVFLDIALVTVMR